MAAERGGEGRPLGRCENRKEGGFLWTVEAHRGVPSGEKRKERVFFF